MRVRSESWCFCRRVGKCERIKASIFSGKAPAMVRISAAGNRASTGTGFLIHRNLLLTTHVNLPSVVAAETAEIRLQNDVAAALFPHRFFITSSVLDLTIVGLDPIDGETSSQTHHPHCLKTCSKPNLDLGSMVYILGHNTETNKLEVGEGKLVIATDSLVKLSAADDMIWSSGSAGFDVQGNLAFLVCDPKKLVNSPSSTSSSSSSSRKMDKRMLFGIPFPVIRDWLSQHWEGSIDELTKPKLPLIRFMSSGRKSEHSSASFTMRCNVFEDDIGTQSAFKMRDITRPSSSTAAENTTEENQKSDHLAAAHIQGTPTPEIHESPKMTSIPLGMKELTQIQHLDINIPPRITKVASLNPQPAKFPPLNYSNKKKLEMEKLPVRNPARRKNQKGDRDRDAEIALQGSAADVSSTGSVNGAESVILSSSSSVEVPEAYENNGHSSEVETMYSAETAESRNYSGPPRAGKYQQSCVSYNKLGSSSPNLVGGRGMPDKRRSFDYGKKVYSQGATSQRSNDYFSPTVSSIMKKRIGTEQPIKKPRPRRIVNSSSKWTS